MRCAIMVLKTCRMFNDAFGTKEKKLYFKPLEHIEQMVQQRFGMSVDELYVLPKQ
jgi:hypothetical protein